MTTCKMAPMCNCTGACLKTTPRKMEYQELTSPTNMEGWVKRFTENAVQHQNDLIANYLAHNPEKSVDDIVLCHEVTPSGFQVRIVPKDKFYASRRADITPEDMKLAQALVRKYKAYFTHDAAIHGVAEMLAHHRATGNQ